MDNEIKAVEHVVEILFDPNQVDNNPFTYRVDGDKPSPIFNVLVAANVAVFRFYVTTKGTPPEPAVLASSPIQWFSPERTPVPLPSSFFFQRSDDVNMILINLNEVTESGVQVDFGFEIGAVFQGKTYTSPDPTIINVQPPPTPEPRVWQESHERPASGLVS